MNVAAVRVPAMRNDPAATVSAMRRELSRTFADAGIERPDLDVRILVGHALGLDHASLAANAGRTLDDGEHDRIRGFASRRLAGEPVARILGTKEFWGLALRVTPDVLVPRPETETIVEASLAWIDTAGTRARPLRIADLCTGSGALLAALLSELPHAVGVATDCSLAALRVARENCTRHGVADRAQFVACDFTSALTGGFDLVVANPPYVETAVIATLPPEVREHDPHLALDGGADGLDAVRAIAADAARLLASTGRMLIEIGAGQQIGAEAALRDAGLRVLPASPDLAGIPRVVAATRR